jgi:hypothetical protein
MLFISFFLVLSFELRRVMLSYNPGPREHSGAPQRQQRRPASKTKMVSTGGGGADRRRGGGRGGGASSGLQEKGRQPRGEAGAARGRAAAAAAAAAAVGGARRGARQCCAGGRARASDRCWLRRVALQRSRRHGAAPDALGVARRGGGRPGTRCAAPCRAAPCRAALTARTAAGPWRREAGGRASAAGTHALLGGGFGFVM